MTHTHRRSSRSHAIGLAAAAILASATASAQEVIITIRVGGGYGQAPANLCSSTPLTTPDAAQYLPLAWTWLHWWEANREAFIEAPVKRHEAAADAAAASLIAAVRRGSGEAQSAAAIALGRIGDPAAAPILTTLAAKGAGAPRRAALLALGMIDDEDGACLRALRGLDGRLADAEDVVAWALGFAMLRGVEPDDMAMLTARFEAAEDVPEVRVALLKAITRHATGPDAVALQGALPTTCSPWEAAILMDWMAGRPPTDRSLAALADMALYTDPVREWHVVDRLERQIRARADWVLGNAVAASREDRGENVEPAPCRVGLPEHWFADEPDFAMDKQGRLVERMWGLEDAQLARLMGSASIALGQAPDSRVERALTASLLADFGAFDRFHQPHTMMSLASIGRPLPEPARAFMVALVEPTHAAGGRRSLDDLEDPLRGFAAVALGRAIRHLGEDITGSPADPEAMSHLLAHRVIDARETASVRAAAALGLGLSGRPENVKLLRDASDALGAAPDLVIGYVLLGRALLGDDSIVAPAGRFLTGRRDRNDPTGVAGRRAAVLALGAAGAEDGAPILAKALGMEPPIALEAARACALIGHHGPARALTKALGGRADPGVRAQAASCLGLMHAHRLGAELEDVLVIGTNFQMRFAAFLPYQAMANNYLYSVLIPELESAARAAKPEAPFERRWR